MTCSLGQTHIFPLKGKRILIVDDDDVSADRLASELHAPGAAVLKSSSTDQAVDLAQTANVSLAVIDPECRGQDAVGIAHVLLECGIPFVIHTYRSAEAGRWASMPLVLKPDHCGEVARTILPLAQTCSIPP
jgi:response regulator RpfG family c-di-GMP phosphodiesterase